MEMTEKDWSVANRMAGELVSRDCDPNEVAKAFAYLRTHPKDPRRFFEFLKTLVDHGRFLVRSGRTLDYYRALQEVCNQHLGQYRSDPKRMAQVLGWAVRLMRYYMLQTPAPSPKERPGQRGPHRRGRG
jgi:hypothetical protein